MYIVHVPCFYFPLPKRIDVKTPWHIHIVLFGVRRATFGDYSLVKAARDRFCRAFV